MKHSASLLQRNKFYLLLPAVVCPFLVLLFWLLGGGSGEQVMAAATAKGLNLQLPDAKVESISALDKLSFYTMAKQDSLKRVELQQLDPNYSAEDVEDEEAAGVAFVEKKYAPVYRPSIELPESKSTASIDQLQALVTELQAPRKDPDMEVLNATLQQLVALQQPTVPKVAGVAPQYVFAVQTSQHLSKGGFFGESVIEPDSVTAGLIRAVVHGEQTIQAGAVVKLRLVEDVFIQHVTIPAGTFLFGLAAFDQERIQIGIRSIPFKGQLYPVALRVLDIDGLEGIYMPGSTAREVVKQAAEQSVQSLGLVGVDQSLQSQAAAAGIGTVKNLLGRKARQVRVTLKSGYQVFLQDEKRRAE